MNYYIVIIISLIFILPLATYYIFSKKLYNCNKELMSKTNLTKNGVINSKSQFNQDVVMYFKLF